VEAMFSLIYDEEKALRYAMEEGQENGLAKGRKIICALKEKVPTDKIAAQYNISSEMQLLTFKRVNLFNIQRNIFNDLQLLTSNSVN
jgi:hypothetical protein